MPLTDRRQRERRSSIRYSGYEFPVVVSADWLGADPVPAVNAGPQGVLVLAAKAPEYHASGFAKIASGDKECLCAFQVKRVQAKSDGNGHYVGLAVSPVDPRSAAYAALYPESSPPAVDLSAIVQKQGGVSPKVVKWLLRGGGAGVVATFLLPYVRQLSTFLRGKTPTSSFHLLPYMGIAVLAGAWIVLLGCAFKLVTDVLANRISMLKGITLFVIIGTIMLATAGAWEFAMIFVRR